MPEDTDTDSESAASPEDLAVARLDRSVTRLEKALAGSSGRKDGKASGRSAAETRRLREALEKAGEQNAALEGKVADASSRLGTVIAELKTVLER